MTAALPHKAQKQDQITSGYKDGKQKDITQKEYGKNEEGKLPVWKSNLHTPTACDPSPHPKLTNTTQLAGLLTENNFYNQQPNPIQLSKLKNNTKATLFNPNNDFFQETPHRKPSGLEWRNKGEHSALRNEGEDNKPPSSYMPGGINLEDHKGPQGHKDPKAHKGPKDLRDHQDHKDHKAKGDRLDHLVDHQEGDIPYLDL
ncbi:hypothetical protein GYMLUDRAFT_61789 [Collybiopsis luxurians FD-317 M1]|uniref:Uncharacterized protein n=1 Tax=Collybiopsis luxurians FD-317 M1 TaxID=944289 RepID=A0A0D0C316_9AGAR|nr:hypothetical protein GYMLUDRAFT_61789 [Collybiopsis luxurians FD-317 M1]